MTKLKPLYQHKIVANSVKTDQTLAFLLPLLAANKQNQLSTSIQLPNDICRNLVEKAQEIGLDAECLFLRSLIGDEGEVQSGIGIIDIQGENQLLLEKLVQSMTRCIKEKKLPAPALQRRQSITYPIDSISIKTPNDNSEFLNLMLKASNAHMNFDPIWRLSFFDLQRLAQLAKTHGVDTRSIQTQIQKGESKIVDRQANRLLAHATDFGKPESYPVLDIYGDTLTAIQDIIRQVSSKLP